MPEVSSSGRSRGRDFPGSVFVSRLSAVVYVGLGSVLFACTDRDARLGTLNDSFRAPEVLETSSGSSVLSTDARYEIVFQDGVPTDAPRLLFMGSRAASPLEDGSTGWTDTEGARAFVFDSEGVVREVLQGAPPAGLPPTRPWWVVASDGGLHTVEADGRELRFEDGAPLEWVAPEFGGPRVSSHGGSSVAVRSVMNFDLRPLERDASLLWLTDAGGAQHGIGEVIEGAQAFLAPLMNTGWATVDDQGIVFASALQPLLRQFRKDGSLEWEARWTASEAFPTPRFRAVRGAAEPEFAVAQYGLVLGARGRIYVLAASAPGAEPTTLLVFDRSGQLVARGTLPEGAAVLENGRGELFLTDEAAVLTRTPESVRSPFPPFDLASLDGEGRVRLEDLNGRVAVVNFWASWCAPCRREIPVLNEMARTMDANDVAIVGLNEDVRPDEGRRFLEELGGVSYPSGMGQGKLRDVYGYRGLPFTVILDRSGRVVRTLYGFGEDLDAIQSVVEEELSR